MERRASSRRMKANAKRKIPRASTFDNFVEHTDVCASRFTSITADGSANDQPPTISMQQ
jgi:hypothetical protein